MAPLLLAAIIGLPFALRYLGRRDPEEALKADAAALAEEYFRLYPRERDLNVLAASLPLDLVDAEIVERVMKDYESGDLVRLKEWYLSRTEARLIALLVLSDAAQSPDLSHTS